MKFALTSTIFLIFLIFSVIARLEEPKFKNYYSNFQRKLEDSQENLINRSNQTPQKSTTNICKEIKTTDHKHFRVCVPKEYGRAVPIPYHLKEFGYKKSFRKVPIKLENEALILKNKQIRNRASKPGNGNALVVALSKTVNEVLNQDSNALNPSVNNNIPRKAPISSEGAYGTSYSYIQQPHGTELPAHYPPIPPLNKYNPAYTQYEATSDYLSNKIDLDSGRFNKEKHTLKKFEEFFKKRSESSRWADDIINGT